MTHVIAIYSLAMVVISVVVIIRMVPPIREAQGAVLMWLLNLALAAWLLTVAVGMLIGFIS